MNGAGDLHARFMALKSPAAKRQLLGKLGLRAVFHAQALVPRKTGNLARTIRIAEVTDEHVRVAAGGDRHVGYAADVEFGTRAHDIVPRTRKALAWGGTRRLTGSLRTGAKAIYFATRVHHPGTKAKPYLVPGSRKALEDAGLSDVIVSVWNKAA